MHAAIAFTPSPGGPTYQVLRTIEFDTYESSPVTAAVSQLVQQGPPSPTAIAAALRAAPGPLSDNFAGNARMAAKLAIGTGPTEQFADVRALIATQPADHVMIQHVPPIDTSSTSVRVTEEQRNIHVVGFLYAASREADNDFHLVVGRDPATPPEMYMTMEISGLPPDSSPAFAARNGGNSSFSAGFTSRSMRRSEMPASATIAIAR